MSKIEQLTPDEHALNLVFQNAVQDTIKTFQEQDKLLGQAMVQVAMVLARKNNAFKSEAVLTVSKEMYGYLGEAIAAQLNGIATRVSEYRNVAAPRL